MAGHRRMASIRCRSICSVCAERTENPLPLPARPCSETASAANLSARAPTIDCIPASCCCSALSVCMVFFCEARCFCEKFLSWRESSCSTPLNGGRKVDSNKLPGKLTFAIRYFGKSLVPATRRLAYPVQRFCDNPQGNTRKAMCRCKRMQSLPRAIAVTRRSAGRRVLHQVINTAEDAIPTSLA